MAPDNTEETDTAPREPLLLPAQREVLDSIRIPVNERPVYTSELSAELAGMLEGAVEGVAVPQRGLWVSKRSLTDVTRCEKRYVVSKSLPFEWSVPMAVGVVLHKAVELSVHSPSGPGAGSVRQAIEQLGSGHGSLGEFMSGLDEGEYDDLVSTCSSMAERFSETFPDVRTSWRPASEVSARYRMRGGDIVLSAKYDLTLGRPDAVEDGFRAGKVIVDLKTGNRGVSDVDDLLFYSLVETLSVGVPPMAVGTFYVSEGRIDVVEVDRDSLISACERTIRGISQMSSLLPEADEVREPTATAGLQCSWCPALSECEVGQAWTDDD